MSTLLRNLPQNPPLVWIQKLDQWENPDGEPMLALPQALVHAQIMDDLDDIDLVQPVGKLTGVWTVRSRRWETFYDAYTVTPCITLSVRQD